MVNLTNGYFVIPKKTESYNLYMSSNARLEISTEIFKVFLWPLKNIGFIFFPITVYIILKKQKDKYFIMSCKIVLFSIVFILVFTRKRKFEIITLETSPIFCQEFVLNKYIKSIQPNDLIQFVCI